MRQRQNDVYFEFVVFDETKKSTWTSDITPLANIDKVSVTTDPQRLET